MLLQVSNWLVVARANAKLLPLGLVPFRSTCHLIHGFIYAMTSGKSLEAAFAQRPDLRQRIVQTIGTSPRSFAASQATKLTGMPLKRKPQTLRGCSETLRTTLLIFSRLGAKVRKMNPPLRSENWNIDPSSQLGGTRLLVAPWPMYPFRYHSGRSIICKWVRRPEYGHPAPLLVNPPSSLE